MPRRDVLEFSVDLQLVRERGAAKRVGTRRGDAGDWIVRMLVLHRMRAMPSVARSFEPTIANGDWWWYGCAASDCGARTGAANDVRIV